MRQEPTIIVFKRGLREEKVALYTDNILLFLSDTNSSLSHVMSLMNELGIYSGLIVNWKKSMLLPLHVLFETLRGLFINLKGGTANYFGNWRKKQPRIALTTLQYP